MKNDKIISIIGVVSSFIFFSFYISQTYYLLKLKNSSGLSIITSLILLFGLSLYFIFVYYYDIRIIYPFVGFEIILTLFNIYLIKKYKLSNNDKNVQTEDIEIDIKINL